MATLKQKPIYFPIIQLGLVLLVSFALGSCSTKKNTWMNRTYHSINAYFNGYFNASQIYNDGISRLAKGHSENYDQALHIFRYGDDSQRSALAGGMDQIYEKCSRVIRKHSMLIKGTEYNSRIPASYLLIAKSHFFQKNYPLSIIALEHIVRGYTTSHVYDAKIWIAKNYVFDSRYDPALLVLNEIKKDIEEKLLNRRQRQLYYLVAADLRLKQKNYQEAIPFLQEAIKETKNQRERTRYTYILGQIYQEIGDYTNAQETFARVLKMSPTFELDFQARISMATAFDPATGNSQEVYNELNKMLGQKKNQAFRDRIYYAMAQLALRENNETLAVELFQKSIDESIDNRMQKGLSFLKLGELYFKQPSYLNASISYDSTVVFLPGNFERIDEIKKRQVVLSDLAKHIRIVNIEDSLQVLAALTAAERNQVIDGIIAKHQEEQRLREQETQDLGSSAYRTQQMRTEFAGETGWYFYNRNTIIAGQAEFNRRFGNRPLEDLWRIGNKQMIAVGFDPDADSDTDTEEDEASGDGSMTRASLMQNVPTTPEKLEQSNKKYSDALFSKGMIYVERINDKKSAIRVFEKIVDRFPASENILHAYYYVINLHEDLNQTAQASKHRAMLLENHPQSDFARILRDPQFRRTLVEQKNAAELLYSETYNAFKSGNYSRVFANVDQANELQLRTDLKAQFSYLKALSHGKTNQDELLKSELADIVQNYAGTKVHQPAQTLLASLGMPVATHHPVDMQPQLEKEDEPKIAIEKIEEVEPVVYKVNGDALHFFVAVVNVKEIDVVEFTNILKAFNDQNFRDRRLIVTNVFFDDNRQIVTVSSFDNKNRAMQYFRSIEPDGSLAKFPSNAFAYFLISVDNYALFYQNKNVGNYLRFFNENY